MTDQNSEEGIDELLTKVQDILTKTYSEFDILEKIGIEFQEKGAILVEYAKLGKNHINFQLSEAPKYAQAANSIPQFTSVLGGIITSGEIVHISLLVTNNELRKGLESVNQGIFFASGSTSTASAGTYAVSSITDQINLDNNKRDIYKDFNFLKPDFDKHQTIQRELDQELNKLNPNLSIRLKGAWQTFNSVSADKKAQAAHTMRDILAKLISAWASNDDVKKAEWWSPVEKTENGVSLRQRLQFLLYGPKNVEDTLILNSIEYEVGVIYKSDELLKKVAHGSQKDINLVESNMKLIESTILKIIRLKNQKK
jgi:hypothetical protein